MKTCIAWISLVCSLVNSFGCRQKETTFSGFTLKDSTRAVLMVPLEGCHGCVSETMDFIRQHSHQDHAQYIISASNRKDIDITLKKYGISLGPSIIPDPSNQTEALGLTDGYPSLQYLSKGTNPAIRKISAENLETELLILARNLEYWNSRSPIYDLEDLDILPAYAGGLQQFYNLISNNIAYEEHAEEGRAVIEVVIDTYPFGHGRVLRD